VLCFVLTGCGGAREEGKVWFKDADLDLYTDGEVLVVTQPPASYIREDQLLGSELDCNDSNADVYPGANELVLQLDNDCSSFARNIALLNRIAAEFNTPGFFYKAAVSDDISYQEVILYLTTLNVYYDDVFSVENIKDSVHWSFLNLRAPAGGFEQDGEVGGLVRTSLYLFSLASSCLLDVRLLPVCEEYASEILESATWVSGSPRPWAGNHDLAALLMFYQLFQLTSNLDYYEMYSVKRTQLIAGFVHKTDDLGYWPEAPSGWSNRLLTPYLQTQIIFAGYYLVLNPLDSEFKQLFIKESNLFASYADMRSLLLDVTASYDYIDGESDETIPLVHPSVVYHLCLQTGLYCDFANDSSHEALFYESMVTNFAQDGDVTLFSDSFLRFGVIPEISDLILRSGRSYQKP
jgi:hypothetical protein